MMWLTCTEAVLLDMQSMDWQTLQEISVIRLHWEQVRHDEDTWQGFACILGMLLENDMHIKHVSPAMFTQ